MLCSVRPSSPLIICWRSPHMPKRNPSPAIYTLRSVDVFILFSDIFFVTNSKRQWQYLVDYSLIPPLESHKNLSIIKKHTLQWFSSFSFGHSREWNRAPLNPSRALSGCVFVCLSQSAIQVDSFQFKIIILSDENAWNFYSFNFHHTTSVFYEWSNFVNTIMWMVVYISAWIGHFPLYAHRSLFSISFSVFFSAQVYRITAIFQHLPKHSLVIA